MCSTDHFLAEIKVANSAPGGLPWHSFLHYTSTLIGQQKTLKLRLLTQTDLHTERPSFCTGHVLLDEQRLWQMLTGRSGLEHSQALCLSGCLSFFPSVLNHCRLVREFIIPSPPFTGPPMMSYKNICT